MYIYISATVPPGTTSGVLEGLLLSPCPPGFVDLREPPPPSRLAYVAWPGPPFFGTFFDHVFDGLANRFLTDFWSILGPTWPPKSTKNRPKIDQKSIKKAIQLPIDFLIDFGSILDRFWSHLGLQVGRPRGPKPLKKTNGFFACLVF